MSNLAIEITDEDYKNCNHENSLDCALSRAVKRTLNLKTGVATSIMGVMINNRTYKVRPEYGIREFRARVKHVQIVNYQS